MTIPYPPKERAIRSLLVAPLLPVGILFLVDAIDRAVQFGALYIFGAAMLAFYMLIVAEVFSMVLGGAALVVLWGRMPFNLFLRSGRRAGSGTAVSDFWLDFRR